MSGEKPLSTKDIQSNIDNEPFLQVEKSQLYAILDKLCNAYILKKDGTTYTIHPLWILQNQRISAGYTITQILLPAANASSSYTFRQAKKLNNLRMELVAFAYLQYPNENGYCYDSHMYFSLVQHYISHNIFGQYSQNTTIYSVIGNTTFLDHYAVKQLSITFIEKGTKKVVRKTRTTSPFPREGYSLYVIGAYTFEVFMPAIITTQLQHFFKTIKNIEEFNAKKYTTILNQRANFVLKISHNKQLAQKHKNNIMKMII